MGQDNRQAPHRPPTGVGHLHRDGSARARPNADFNSDYADYADCSEGIEPSNPPNQVSLFLVDRPREAIARPR